METMHVLPVCCFHLGQDCGDEVDEINARVYGPRGFAASKKQSPGSKEDEEECITHLID